MIKNLAQLSVGLYADAAKAQSTHGLHFVSVGDYLLELFEKGEIEAGLITEEAIKAGISPVRQMLAHSGVILGGMNASTMAVFDRTSPEYVKGAENLLPALMMEMYMEAMGLPTSNLQAADSFSVTPNSTSSSLYPLQERGMVDQRLEQPAGVLTIDEIVSLRTGVDGDGYRSAQIKNDQRGSQNEWGRVAPGADLPLYTLELAERAVRVYKYGGKIRLPYEAMRRMKINVLQMLLQEMAFSNDIWRVKNALEVAVNGDGNGNGYNLSSVTPTNWNIQELDEWAIDVANDASLGMNRVVADAADVKLIRALRYPAANTVLTPDQLAMYSNGLAYQMPDGTPLRLAPKGSILAGSKTAMGWNTARALEEVVENGSQIQEMARNIENQTHIQTMSINIGHTKPFDNSFQAIQRD